jgi:5-(carboxyamino)imidazole ribonucleotide synthase
LKKAITIGILGGGQLARMSAFAAKRLGLNVAILETKKDSPAAQVSDLEFTGRVNNKTLLKKFAAACDVITLENEFVDYHWIEYIESLGKKVFPSSKTISLIQDKLIQKETLAQNKIPVPKFISVNHKNEFTRIVDYLGLPFVLKSRKMGYDGYGNALIKDKKGFGISFDKLVHRHSKLLAEEFVNFKMELAVMTARTKNDVVIYPVVQTIQKNHICHTVIAPAQVNEKIIKLAKELAVRSVFAVKGYGIFGIEMFLTRHGKLLINEMAPRPHNSGHYTIEANITSQFENHIRAVLGLPLGSAEMISPHAVMINLLGKTNDEGIIKNYSKALADPGIHLHIYGKRSSRIGRKMGHITVTGTDSDNILERAYRTEKGIII